MDLKDFIAIRGKGDLYRVMSKSNKGIIVETLNEKRTKFKVQPNLQVLVLNDVTIYASKGEDIRLEDIFIKLNEKAGNSLQLDLKSDSVELIDLFKEVAPDYDHEKVYLSDMKKTFRWYMTLCHFYPNLFEDLKKSIEEKNTQETQNDAAIEETPKTTEVKVPEVKKEKQTKSKSKTGSK